MAEQRNLPHPGQLPGFTVEVLARPWLTYGQGAGPGPEWWPPRSTPVGLGRPWFACRFLGAQRSVERWVSGDPPVPETYVRGAVGTLGPARSQFHLRTGAGAFGRVLGRLATAASALVERVRVARGGGRLPKSWMSQVQASELGPASRARKTRQQ